MPGKELKLLLCLDFTTYVPPGLFWISVHCALLHIVSVLFTFTDSEGIHLPGLYNGWMPNQLHCECGNIFIVKVNKLFGKICNISKLTVTLHGTLKLAEYI